MSDLIQFCIGIQFNQATEIISVKLCHLFTDLPDRTGEPLGKIDTEHNRYHCHKQINPDQHRKYLIVPCVITLDGTTVNTVISELLSL